MQNTALKWFFDHRAANKSVVDTAKMLLDAYENLDEDKIITQEFVYANYNDIWKWFVAHSEAFSMEMHGYGHITIASVARNFLNNLIEEHTEALQMIISLDQRKE